MRSWFVESDQEQFETKSRFASPWIIISFVLVAVLLLFFFFPKQDLLKNIASQKEADQVAKQYLRNLTQLYPEDRKLTLLLAAQNIGLGKLSAAIKSISPFIVKEPKTQNQWRALWLYYQIIRIETYAKPKISYDRSRGLLQMRQLSNILLKHQLTSSQLMELAEDAINMDKPEIAIKLYQQVIKMPVENIDATMYAKAGRHALGYSQYQMSADLYFIAQKLIPDITNKRTYFVLGLKSLQSGSLLDQAMIAAQKNINGLNNDKDTLVFLTKLALAANRPDLAQKYIKRVLKLKVTANKT